MQETALEARARRAASKAGYKAIKSRRSPSIDNRLGFQIIDPERNAVIVGERFDLSARDVIEFCADK